MYLLNSFVSKNIYGKLRKGLHHNNSDKVNRDVDMSLVQINNMNKNKL
jgi:hypothetical protein